MQYFLCVIANLLLECLGDHVHGVYVCVHGYQGLLRTVVCTAG